jgi:mannose-1-phosphate guanylyltransferase/mannose-6-phosphate isomerase
LIEQFRPDMAAAVRQAYAAGQSDLDFYRADADLFAASPADSIDYAVMEPLSSEAGECLVVPLDAGWSDIGAWSALWEVLPRDQAGNATHGDVIAFDSHDNLLHAQERVIAAIGVQDLVVVETSDAVLVVHKDHTQDVKKITQHLDDEGRCESEFHRRVHRPWGAFESIDAGERYQVKRLTVSPGESLCRCRCTIIAPSIGSSSPARRGSPATTRLPARREPVHLYPGRRQAPAGESRARCRWRSSRCSPAATSARTTSCASRTSTTAAGEGC